MDYCLRCVDMLILVILATILCQAQGDDVDYYMDEWYKAMNASESWNRPVDNSDFKYNRNKRCKDYDAYDYIVVGAGSAGGVLASRLSEDPSLSVLLLEAGGDEDFVSLTPGAIVSLRASPKNWGYLTVPQKNACLGMKHQQCEFARGKVLGGSSGINAILYVRGNKDDFNKWGRMGNAGWSYDEVLPYFIKAENAVNISVDPGYAGYDGPLTITYNEPVPPYYYDIIAANEEAGSKYTDYNGANQIGISRMQSNVKDGERQSTNQAYIQPALQQSRSNLVVLKHALATKIEINRDKVATGVIFTFNKQCYIAKARKEVIVSGGSVNSPQLLMLSGIGPAAELKKHNIKQIVDLPVGLNMYDHFCLYNIALSTNVTNKAGQASLRSMMEEYVNNKTGYLGYVEGLEVGFVRLGDGDPSIPNVEAIFNLQRSYTTKEIVMKVSNYDHNMESTLDGVDADDILLHMMLLDNKSVGSLTLKSANPLDFPQINPRYLTNRQDVDTLIDGIMHYVNLVNTTAFQRINAQLKHTPIAACDEKYNYDTDPRGYWECQMRYRGYGIFHPIGTNRMGNSMRTSVVDNNLKVHGVKNLRVIDASVIPAITTGHLNAVVIMMGERMADLIKNNRML